MCKPLDKRSYVEPRKPINTKRNYVDHVKHNKNIKEERIELYTQRYKQGLDLFTGKDLGDGKAGK
jgi:hypothetical protein